jgi:protein arginine N-methyltransferase 1
VSLILDEHRQYLADQNRVAAFRNAIAEVVKPGDVVVDLGAGTGVLGLFACQAGARRVYSIDDGAIIGLARDLSRANGFGERVTFLKELSTRVELPEKADVVVADQIGHFGFEAGILPYFEDARARFLKPGAALIPSRIDMCVAPVEAADSFAQVEFWNAQPAGLDFAPARAIAANTGYPIKLRPEQLLAEPVVAISLDLASVTAEPFSLSTSLTVGRAGTLHGIGGWFTAQMSSRVTMSNGPLAAHPITRSNVFLPVDHAVDVAPGDAIAVTLHVDPRQVVLTWKVEVRDDGGPSGNGHRAAFAHSTFRGMLVCREDLERTRPQFVPVLSPRGEARRSVVNLCDGHRTLRDIEAEVQRRHPDLFPSLAKAAEFVAEVVTRYAR